MKKILLSLFVLFLGVVAKSQNGTPLYPVTQNLGGTSTLIDVKGGQRIAGAFVLGHYADTTAANAVPYVKNFANGLITTDTNLLWIRSYNAQQWYFVPNTGNPATGDTLYWRVGGNALIPMQQQGIYTGLGSKDSTPLFFITNYQRRLVIPPNGVNRSAGTANKCLVIDTVTKFMYYTDCGSGGGTTYTFTNGLTESGGTVKLGGTLVDATTTINADGNDLEISNVSNFSVNGSGGDLSLYNERSGNSSSFNTDGSGFANIYSHVTASPTNRSEMLFTPDSITIQPHLGRLIIDTLNYTLSTTGKKIMLRDTATGLVQNIDASLLGGSTAISALTAATGTNDIDNGSFQQIWRHNTLSSGFGMTFLSNSTAASGNAQTLFTAQLSGTNSSSNQTTRTSTFLNTHAGTGAFNVAADFNAYNGATNYAARFQRGKVGLGTAGTESGILEINGVTSGTITIQPAAAAGTYTLTLPTTDGASGEFLQTNGSGVLTWVAGGSGVTTMAAIGSSPNANGATISGSTLNLEPASASFGGVVTTGTQTIAGNKTFTGVSVFGSPTVPAGNVQVGGTIWVSGGAGSTYYGVHDGTNQLTLAPTAMTFAGIGSGSIGYASGVMNIQGNATYSTVVNDNSADVDFRLEGDGDANLIFADAGNDKVGIGTASPTTKLHVAGRFAATQGTDVASAAGAITLSTNGNTFEITGTAAITLISNAGWVNGSEINLIFTSTATLTDGTANSGTDIGMELAGNANFTASADDILTLVLTEVGGTQRWREKSRSVN